MAKLLVADDHDLVRETIVAFLQGEGVGKVFSAATLDEALGQVETEGAFDLVLLDYNMPGMEGLSGLEKMVKANGGKPVAILSGTASSQVMDEAVKSGAVGFVPKTLSSKAMVAAVRVMMGGEPYTPFHVMEQKAKEAMGTLTQREAEVLRGICDGKSNKEIGRELDLQEVTVKLHVKTLCRKLDARNRTHAAMIARNQNML